MKQMRLEVSPHQFETQQVSPWWMGGGQQDFRGRRRKTQAAADPRLGKKAGRKSKGSGNGGRGGRH